MEPIVLIHGYSSESTKDDLASIEAIYGSLVHDLQSMLNTQIVTVDVSRYVSLDDGLDVDDLSQALDRALREHHADLLDSGFNAIIHSTGALVIRNWVRRFSKKPSPLKRIIHLAGANLGSGWAHIGKTQLVKWGRYVFFNGEARGMRVLNALELGSDWTIDLHHHFLMTGNDMLDNYGIMEFNIVGSQVPAKWMLIPIRYGKEDGSDGVMRVAASNLNFNYMKIVPTNPLDVDWSKAEQFEKEATQVDLLLDAMPVQQPFGGYYKIAEDARPEGAVGGTVLKPRHRVPFAIPYNCAHSSDTVGIVYGTETRGEVLPLVKSALNCNDLAGYEACVGEFDAATNNTYTEVQSPQHQRSITEAIAGIFLGGEFQNPQGQYDKHAQVVIRIRDQNDKPINDFDVYFNSCGGNTADSGQTPDKTINALFEDTHKNDISPNIITYYLRVEEFVDGQGFVSRLPEIKGVDLEIDAHDISPGYVKYVPVRLRISETELAQWIQPHRTTIIDVQMLRIPADSAFIIREVP